MDSIFNALAKYPKLKTALRDNAPLYIYNEEVIRDNIARLQRLMPRFSYLYSVKANPYPGVVKLALAEGMGVDACSVEEIKLAESLGKTKDEIFYSCPGKTIEDLRYGLKHATLIVDSLGEIKKIRKLVETDDIYIKLGIRVHPDFPLGDTAVEASKFGIDIHQVEEVSRICDTTPRIKINGLHFHLRSQLLNVALLASYYKKCFAMAISICHDTHIVLDYINFGSGIGIVYDKSKDRPVDLERLYRTVEQVFVENSRSLRAKLYIETGRFVTADAGYYCTRIVDIKSSYSKKYLIVQNGMNGFLRPAIAALFARDASGVGYNSHEPLFTSVNAFSLEVINDNPEKERVTVVGNLCTSLDVMKEDVLLNKAEVGDLLLINNAGSYAYSLSPLEFSSFAKPQQLVLHPDGSLSE